MLSLLSPRFNDCYRAVDRELLTAAAPKHVDDLRNGTRVELVFVVFAFNVSRDPCEDRKSVV